MAKIDIQNINVLNYNENEVFVDSARENYRFSASRDGKNPSIVTMPLTELQYIASNTNIIITGWLTFDNDLKAEIFKLLRISDWENILSNDDIVKILTHPTLDTLQKIIDVDNQTYFDRIRIIMFKLMNDGVDITTKVSRVVEQRYDELQKRQRISSIILSKKDTNISLDKAKELAEQNASLQSQLDDMKKMMEQMIKTQNEQKIDKAKSANQPENKVESTSEKPIRTKKAP